jgi:predicted RNase H-like HicB family nuclease
MERQYFEAANRLASRNYDIVMTQQKLSDGNVVFVTRNPELTGCKAQGETPMKAVVNLRDARVDYIHSLLEDGATVPGPTSDWCTLHLK